MLITITISKILIIELISELIIYQDQIYVSFIIILINKFCRLYKITFDIKKILFEALQNFTYFIVIFVMLLQTSNAGEIII